MPYCTTRQVEELVEQAGNMAPAVQTTLEQVIAQAQAWADGFLRGASYDVPFAAGAVPEYVATMVATRAAYLLLRRVNVGGSFTEAANQFAKDADVMSKAIASGAVRLEINDAIAEPYYNPMALVSNPHGRPGWRYGSDGQRVR